MKKYLIVNNIFNEAYRDVIPLIKSRPFLYLFHGTILPKIPQIKQDGLRRDKQWYAVDAQVKAGTGKSDQVIFLTSSYSHAQTYTKSAFGLKFWEKRVQVLLCKVNTKFIKHHAGMQLTKKRYADEYWYYADIPAKNIMLETDPRYLKIVKKESYLYHPETHPTSKWNPLY